MSEIRAFLENQKERLKIIKAWSRGAVTVTHVEELCRESIADIDRYLERHEESTEDEEEHRGDWGDFET